jgi:RimJ/RimL family protein N-acetyltransferase
LITTERLLLRKPRLQDDLSEYVADGHAQRWIPLDDGAAEVMEHWMHRWEANGVGPFVIELGGELIGRVGFLVFDRRTWERSTYELAGEHAETELGWAILSRHWGHGYATEAARGARDWLGGTRVISLIDPANTPSIRVAEKLGARRGDLVQTPGGAANVWEHP